MWDCEGVRYTWAMSETWTVKAVLDWMVGYLAQHGDANPQLSSQWLVADVLGCSRIELYADLDRPLSDDERVALRSHTSRRAAGEPLQYITGTTGFRFLTLSVEPGVLIPRPETEVLVSEALDELARSLPRDRGAHAPEFSQSDLEGAILVRDEDGGLVVRFESGKSIPVAIDANGEIVEHRAEEVGEEVLVADLCTGSGNVACSIASELACAKVLACDISPEACSLARRNVDALGLEGRVIVFEGDLASALPESCHGKVDLVVSNPPYIPTGELSALDPEVAAFEPRLALDGGADGLSCYRRVLDFSKRALKAGGVLAVELHETCLEEACAIAKGEGFAFIRVAEDLAGRPRVLVARMPD